VNADRLGCFGHAGERHGNWTVPDKVWAAPEVPKGTRGSHDDFQIPRIAKVALDECNGIRDAQIGAEGCWTRPRLGGIVVIAEIMSQPAACQERDDLVISFRAEPALDQSGPARDAGAEKNGRLPPGVFKRGMLRITRFALTNAMTQAVSHAEDRFHLSR